MDERAFADAVNENRDMLYRISYTILHSNEDCADALQNALFKAWQHLGTLRDDTRFRSWLASIVVNTSRDVLRRRKLQTVALTEDIPAPKVQDKSLNETLSRLDEKLRLVITLHYMEGMSIKEISATLAIPQGMVKNRLYRGRQKLKQMLCEEGLFDEAD